MYFLPVNTNYVFSFIQVSRNSQAIAMHSVNPAAHLSQPLQFQSKFMETIDELKDVGTMTRNLLKNGLRRQSEIDYGTSGPKTASNIADERA
jgi:hypothetical protein